MLFRQRSPCLHFAIPRLLDCAKQRPRMDWAQPKENPADLDEVRIGATAATKPHRATLLLAHSQAAMRRS